MLDQTFTQFSSARLNASFLYFYTLHLFMSVKSTVYAADGKTEISRWPWLIAPALPAVDKRSGTPSGQSGLYELRDPRSKT